MSEFNCRAIGNKDSEVPSITVGDLFRIQCEKIKTQGETDATVPVLDPQSYLTTVEKDKFTLKMIETPLGMNSASPSTDSHFEMIVTGYRVGDQNLPEVQLVTTQGTHTLKGIHFKVESIINPKQPPEGPFGPVGPLPLSLPFFYWVILASLLGIVIVLAIVVGFFKRQRKRLIEKLKSKDSSLSPYHQVNAKFRAMMREFGFFSSGKLSPDEGLKIVKYLDETFKLYLTREFYIPAFDWGSRTILRDFKKRHKGLSVYASDDLSLILRELLKAQSPETSMLDTDITHLIKSIRHFVDKIEDLKHKGLDQLSKKKRRFQ